MLINSLDLISLLVINFLRRKFGVERSYMVQIGYFDVFSAMARYFLLRVTARAVIPSEPSMPEMYR
jgi:hypothetical protein